MQLLGSGPVIREMHKQQHHLYTWKATTVCLFEVARECNCGLGWSTGVCSTTPTRCNTHYAFYIIACRDCWCVAFGNSHNDDERCVLAGYDNGDVKLFDLRTNKVRRAQACST
jgi:hypothetical protein